MSEIPLDEVVHFNANVSDPATGGKIDADATPTFAVYEEATDTDIGVGGNMTKRTSLDGEYRGSFTASAANGFEVGKFYVVKGYATVDSVSGVATLKEFRCVAAENTAGYGVVTIKDGTGTGELDTASGAVILTAAYDAAKTAATQASVDAVDNFIDTEIGTIITDIAAVKSDTAAILIDTAEIGAAGAGLTALATQASVNTIDDFLDTEIAAIKAKTDNLPSDPADASDIASSFTTVNTKLDTIDDFLDTEVAAIKAKTDSLTFTVAGEVNANTRYISGASASADNLERSTLGIVLGTVGAASTTTSIVTSALDPAAAVADQFKGKIVTFDRATTTANLRGQSTDITASSNVGVLTCTALTDAPVSGDTFVIT